jgi:hypothetical protein
MRNYFWAILSLFLLFGCGGDSGSGPPDVFTLGISGTFETSANSVSINQIAVIFDNTMPALATKTCNAAEARNCTITATASGQRGNHTVALRLVKQFCNLLPCSAKQPYDLSGNVTVSNATGILQQLPIPKRSFTLGDGDIVVFGITVNP